MGPSLKVLVAFVLEFVLPSLVELNHHMPDIVGLGLVTDVIDHGLLEIVSHDGERLWLWRCRNLLQKVVSECVLNARVFKEDGLGPYVEDSVVALD